MRCPKDADKDTNDTDKLFFCNQSNPNSDIGWRCTRSENHKGKHHAHRISTKECLEVWE